jgi:hypothetical protein
MAIDRKRAWTPPEVRAITDRDSRADERDVPAVNGTSVPIN